MNEAIVEIEAVPEPETTIRPAIEGKGLIKRYGKINALNGLDIRVPTGSVYALLGRNGVGKSTLIQLIMGMLEPSKGALSVLGLDPIRDGVAMKRRLGYIPERLPMYEWMTVAEIIRFVSPLYPNWSKSEELSLIEKFRIPKDRKIRVLSRGYRALLALVLAMAHNPELVLLDECTSGMDAIARREFERSVIDALQMTGRTVLFAGHQIDEMERICDWVGILHEGKMLLEMPIDALKSSVRILRIAGDDAGSWSPSGSTVLERRKSGRDTLLTVRLAGPANSVGPVPLGVSLLEQIPLTLEEIFVALVGQEGGQ